MEWFIIYTSCLNSNWVVLGIVHLCRDGLCILCIWRKSRFTDQSKL